MMTQDLRNYALIGNSCSAALVSRFGSIDWCCLPEFHSPAIFAALLDKNRGGHFSISPVQKNHSSQKYLPDTNVVETSFRTGKGEVRVLDAFTARKEDDMAVSLFPDHEILRIVEGISGKVLMKLDYSPMIFYGRKTPVLKNHKKLGIQFSSNENIFILLSTLDTDKIIIDRKGNANAEFYIRQGERIIFSLSYSNQSPAVLPELKETALKRMQDTINYWQDWIATCKYSGVYLEEVKRSALALKLLAHAPSGSIIAAPTTSLPEKIGGDRNWDYRYCWLRDASFTLRVLVHLGFEEEAHAYMNWILHATQLTRPGLQVVYSVYGHASLKEKTLDWLDGYRNSKPVRIGNNADVQFQLDIYGEVLDAIWTYVPLVREFDRDSRKFIIGLGKMICQLWEKPDNGIWEIRSLNVHHTHSKVMAWVGLDRLIKLFAKYHWIESSLEKFKDTLALISAEIERSGYNAQLQSYTREFNGSQSDASLLTLSIVGYCSYTSSKMLSTVRLIIKDLSKENLVYRYRNIEDGLKGDEGSFAICNFWLTENLVQSGQIEQGIEVFETTLKHASPTGLLSEQIDPETHELLGNYPQGFTHIGVINAALSINDALQRNPNRT